MKYYRCYLLTAEDHIARVTILKCADAADAERQCRALVATSERYAGAEVWDGAHWLYRYPDDPASSVQESRRRAGESDQDLAMAGALDAQGEQGRRRQLLAEAVTVAHLRERHLEQDAQSRADAVANGHRPADTGQGSADTIRPPSARTPKSS
jgi:hypothetical protein